LIFLYLKVTSTINSPAKIFKINKIYLFIGINIKKVDNPPIKEPNIILLNGTFLFKAVLTVIKINPSYIKFKINNKSIYIVIIITKIII